MNIRFLPINFGQTKCELENTLRYFAGIALECQDRDYGLDKNL